MKRNYLLHTVTVLLLLCTTTNCHQTLFEENPPIMETMKEISIKTLISDGEGNTRATITPDENNEIWVSAWANNDKLGAWTNAATHFNDFNIEESSIDNKKKTASFIGSIPENAKQARFVYPFNSSTGSIYNNNYDVDISTQQFDASEPFLYYGKNKPMISELTNVTSGSVKDVKLKNLCAGMEYRIAFKGIKTNQTNILITLIEVYSRSLCSAKSLNLVNGILTEITNQNSISISIYNSPTLNSYTGNKRFSIIGSVFPFEIASGNSIIVKVHTNYGIGVVTKVNTDDKKLDFSLNKHHYINLDVDMSEMDNWIDAASNTFAGGDGTENNPYLISTPEEFAKLAADLKNFPRDDYSGKFIKLNNDINLTGKIWTAIGTNPYVNCFRGTFDGKGKTVTGLYLNNRLQEDQGLFGYLGSGGVIKNLKVVGSLTTEAGSTGGIIGCNLGTVQNCSFSGTITGTNTNIGGIVGWSEGNIKACYNTGEISGLSSNAGGIVGVPKSSQVASCYNSGKITITNNTSFPCNIGGIAGGNISNGFAQIISCYNLGSLTITGGSNNNIGGILGSSLNGSINYCYSLVDKVIDNKIVGDNSSTITSSAILTDAEMKGAFFQYEGTTIDIKMIDELKTGDSNYWQDRPNDYPWLGF